MGIETRSISRRDESAPFRGVIPGVAIVQAGVVVVVIATVANGIGVCNGVVDGARSNGTVAPGIVQVLGYQGTTGVVDAHYVTHGAAVEIIRAGGAACGVLHTDDHALVIEEHDILADGALTVEGFGDSLCDQTACVVVKKLLAAGGELTAYNRVQAGDAFQIGIGLGNPLAISIIAVGIAFRTVRQRASVQPGQPALAPCGGHAVITGGTAHGVVGNAAAAEAGQLLIGVTEGGSHRCAGGRAYILPFFLPAVKKKPPGS